MVTCADVDPVWDRRCEKAADHVTAPTAADRLHRNTLPGDVIRWGNVPDMREVERGGETTGETSG